MGDNPPLWEVVLHFWINLWGTDLVMARVLSLLFSILTIIPLYFIGEKFIHNHAGIVGSLLYTCSSFGVFIAHEARVYSLIGLLVCTSTLLFLYILKYPKKKYLYVLLSLVNVLIFYGHYLGVWIAVVQVIYVLVNKDIRSINLRGMLGTVGLSILLTIPQIPTLLTRFSDSGVNGTWVQKSNGVQDIYFMLLKYLNAPVPTVVFILVLLLAVVLYFKNRQTNNKSIPYEFLLLALWLPFIASFVISFVVGFFLDRYFYFLTPLLYLLVVASIHMLISHKAKLQLAAYAVAVVLMVGSLRMHSAQMRYSGYHKDIRPVVEEIKQFKQQDNVGVFIAPRWSAKDAVYYYDKSMFTSYFDEFTDTCKFDQPLARHSIFAIEDSFAIKKRPSYNAVLYIDDNNDYAAPYNGIVAYLTKNYTLKNQQIVEGRKLYWYKKETE